MMNIAVIFAGGVGSRMKTSSGVPKQFLEIGGIPILVHTLKNFEDTMGIDAIIVVMLEQYIGYTEKLVEDFNLNKVKKVVAGGKTGQESIYAGLKAAKDLENELSGDRSIVLIHDGVRPFVEDGLIEKNIESVEKYGSAISCVPSKETVVRIDEDKNIGEVIDRSTVWLARAPQSFYLDDILAEHEKARENGRNDIIDSCTMMVDAGKKLHIVETISENIKITTPEDYYVAKGLILRKEQMEEGK